jgi:hypothetical protein
MSVTGCSHHSQEPPPASAPTASEQATARPATDLKTSEPEQYQGSYQRGSDYQQGSKQDSELPAGSYRSDTMMENQAQNAGAAASGNQRVVTVTVKDVDRDQHLVTFQAKVRPEANIMRDGTPIRIDQLQPGDSVRMALDVSTGDVTRVDVIRQANY